MTASARRRVATIVGTRPQLIKAAALQPLLRERFDDVFVDTGQHWDERMAGTFFAELGLARPDHSLGAGGGTHAEQTAAMLTGLEPILRDAAPDVVLVFGDTNSTLAGALAAAKLGRPVAHVEAGLRSFDRAMPEELNRIVADHLATWRFAPTEAAVANLAAEGIRDGVILVGDLMQDLAAAVGDGIRDAGTLTDVARALVPAPGSTALPGGALAPGSYLLATVHRAENREPERMAAWLALLAAVARGDRPVILPLHPGTRAAMAELAMSAADHVHVVEPLGYRSSLALQLHAAAVLTDSGGVQREASWLGVPCLVLRGTTEWTELTADPRGRTVLVGLDAALAASELGRLVPGDPRAARAAASDRAMRLALAPAGAAERIVAALA